VINVTIKRVNRKLFYQNIVFNFYLDHIQDDAGNEIKEYFVMQPKNMKENGGGGVAILPFINNKIGLINVYRPPLNSYQWEIPHGFIESGETDQKAAARELAEETGLIVDFESCISLGFVAPDAGVIAARVHLFVVESIIEASQSTYELGLGKFVFFDIYEIKRMIFNSEIQDGFTLVAIFKYLSNKGLVSWNL
jgi:8-oxo-dGTP pyrophosphatase MutT (NUDIX family)